MKCPGCQHDNPAESKFCGECARLESLCPACAASNPLTNKFCHQCGAPLVGAAPPAKFTSPQAYTPKHLAEKILTSRSALEGERKQVAVLFADLKGSMELFADRDPEEARKVLDPVLERMMEAVHRYDGTVNQVMGDGIMALFGAPLAHERGPAEGHHRARTKPLTLPSGDELAVVSQSRLGPGLYIRAGWPLGRGPGPLGAGRLGASTGLAFTPDRLAGRGVSGRWTNG
ncbi:MAG: zinc ribbon domain-containing protein [Candidatus Rokubacteria bacterium]|nr:zinc ribbon domain-containing protein [Candidatus Rokubacteria bacterium]